MRVSGQATLRSPVEAVYAALHDPAVLVRAIPGCERLERVGTDEYRMTVTAGVASVKGTYTGDVRLAGQDAPHAFTMHATGAGAPGTVSADVTVTLTDAGDGATLVSYDADAVVGGMIGGVGQRMLAGVARKTAGEFFAAVDRALAGEAAPDTLVPVGAAAGGRPDDHARRLAALSAAPEVFTRPTGPGAAGGLPVGFLAGAAVGAAAALAGAVVGGWLAGRRR